MIKVRVVRGIQTGLPLASGLMALSGVVTACTAPNEESLEAGNSAYTVADPGTGVMELAWAWGTPTGYSFNAKNSTDEYVRALEKMTFSIPAHFLWSQVHPSEQFPSDVDRLRKLSAKVTVNYLRNGSTFDQASVSTSGWTGDQAYALSATTTSFVVSKKAQAMRFSLEITDTGASPPITKTLGPDSFFDQPVIGANVPDKTILFDTMGQTLRSRVLEGGMPISDSDLMIAYTDWRAATVVDSSTIDRQIGTAGGYSRFGSVEVPIYGDIEFDISYGSTFDGVFEGEKVLAGNPKSQLMPPGGRTAYEGSLVVPAGAQKLEIYFHVRAYLKVDYSRHPDVRVKKYQDGARILMRERWDNENGVRNDNYDFAVEAR